MERGERRGMLDIRRIRENPEEIKRAVEAKRENVSIDRILELDRNHREVVTRLNRMRAELNNVSREISRVMGCEPEQARILREKATELSRAIKEGEEQERSFKGELENLLAWVPNIPHSSVPVGRDSNDNVVVREWGEKPNFPFKPRDHLELGDCAKLFDFKRASKISASFFPLYTDKGAKLERALINFMLDVHTENGYTELFVPFMANRASMFGCGQIPKLEDDMYRVASEDLFLIPTAEVPLTNFRRDEPIPEQELPLKYTAYTPCFRREAGSYGKTTKGLQRVHQFNKVELVKIVKPETSYDELESLVNDAERILQLLGLHYRVVLLCTGDLSFSASKCYDIEVWSPAENKYLEVSSCSNFEDFQARRANIKYRKRDGKMEYVHTLNGSGVATPRLMISLLETYQKENGTIIIPEVLQPYLNGIKEI